MLVVDASALVVAVTDTTERGARVRAELLDGVAAPHLVDAECGQALRGLARREVLPADLAERSLVLARDLVTQRYPVAPLQTRAWALRDNLSFYDATYVALAEVLDVRLLTADRRLASAPGPECPIHLV